MRFFTVTAKVNASSIDKVVTLTNGDKILSQATTQFNKKDTTKFCFVQDWYNTDGTICFGVITKNNDEPNDLVSDFAVALDLHLGDLHVTELAMNYFANVFEYAEHRTYVDERMQILERFDIPTVACPYHPSGAKYRYREYVIDDGRTKEDIINNCMEWADLMNALYDHRVNNYFVLFEVVKSQNSRINLQLCNHALEKALAEALWHGGYIKAKRYVRLRMFSANEHWVDMAKEVCLSSNGGLVVIDISPLEDEMKDAKTKKDKARIERTLEVAKSLIADFGKTLVFCVFCTSAQREKFKPTKQKRRQ